MDHRRWQGPRLEEVGRLHSDAFRPYCRGRVRHDDDHVHVDDTPRCCCAGIILDGYSSNSSSSNNNNNLVVVVVVVVVAAVGLARRLSVSRYGARRNGLVRGHNGVPERRP
jgi:hypothetical protein